MTGPRPSQEHDGPLEKAIPRVARFAFAAGGIVSIVALSYVLVGAGFFQGAVKGNDEAHALTYITWISRYFPSLVGWFPLQGGGISITDGYPIGAHYAVVLLNRASGLSLNTCLRLLEFLTIPLTAIGVYFFAWRTLRNQTAALLAGMFYPLSPISWNWITRGGFIGQGLSIVFVPWVLLFVSIYLEDSDPSAARTDLRKRLALPAAVIFYLAAGLSHYITAIIVLGLVPAYAFCLGVFPARGPRSIRGGFERAKRSIVFECLGLAGIAFRIVPFMRYSRVANREGLNVLATGDIPFFQLDTLLGLPGAGSANVFASDGFSAPVAGLAVLGLIVCLLRNRTFVAWALLTIGTAFFTMLPGIFPQVASRFAYLWSGTNVRAILPAMILVPLFAALFIRDVTRSATQIVSERIGQYVLRNHMRLLAGVTSGLNPLASILLAVVVLAQFPVRLSDAEHILDYGPYGLNACDPWTRHSAEACSQASLLGFGSKLLPSEWPALALDIEDPPPVVGSSLIPDGKRIDISPYLGQLVERLNISSDLSQVNTYAFQLSLIHKMWGYQQGVMYSRVYGSAGAINELGDWYGLNYVYLNTDLDPLEKFSSAGWQPFFLEDNVEIMKNARPTEMATATLRPVVLVIGKPENESYMSIFRLATEGMLPFADAVLVEGAPFVDSYSGDELGRFDSVILYGYDYKDGTRAWELLNDYVRAGGRLFVDTGWQYRIPQWEFDIAPEVLPVARLTWDNFGVNGDYQLQASDVGGDVDTNVFAPLVWESGPWSVSAAAPADVRDWGRVVLSADGNPLIVAGQLGEGRVVWSGMNLVAHALTNRNEEEIDLLHNLVSWLIAGKAGEDVPVTVARESPDRVYFSVEDTSGGRVWLYWRESVYPNWHAYLTHSGSRRKIPIYRAGPGFMLIPIEAVSGDAQVELLWETSLAEKLGTGISAVTLMALVAQFIDGLFLGGRLRARLAQYASRSGRRDKPRGSVKWLPQVGSTPDSTVSVKTGDRDVAGPELNGPSMDALGDQTPLKDEVLLGEGGDVDKLWQKIVESRNLEAAEDDEAEKLISWWRRARDQEDHGD